MTKPGRILSLDERTYIDAQKDALTPEVIGTRLGLTKMQVVSYLSNQKKKELLGKLNTKLTQTQLSAEVLSRSMRYNEKPESIATALGIPVSEVKRIRRYLGIE